MSVRISVEVENFGTGGDGPHHAGLAVVRLNGEIVANLLSREAFEVVVGEPSITTTSGLSGADLPSARSSQGARQ